MTRFLLTLEQAIDLIEWAYFHKDSHGKIAIPKIESLKIVDLANAIAKSMGKEDIEFHKIPIRDGEKLHEDMISEIAIVFNEEGVICYVNGEGYKLVPDMRGMPQEYPDTIRGFMSGFEPIVDGEEIVSLSPDKLLVGISRGAKLSSLRRVFTLGGQA